MAKFFKNATNGHISDPDLIVVGGSGYNEVNVLKSSTGTVSIIIIIINHKQTLSSSLLSLFLFFQVLASYPSYKTVFCLDSQGGFVLYGGKESLVRLGQINLPKKY